MAIDHKLHVEKSVYVILYIILWFCWCFLLSYKVYISYSHYALLYDFLICISDLRMFVSWDTSWEQLSYTIKYIMHLVNKCVKIMSNPSEIMFLNQNNAIESHISG